MYRSLPRLLGSALCAALLTGCARGGGAPPAVEPAEQEQAEPIFPAELIGLIWEWVEFTTPVEQTTVDAPERYTIQLDPDGYFAVQADCNRGQGNYFLPAWGQITIHGLAMTRVACPAGSLSDRFVTLLGLVRVWFVEGEEFFLELPADSGTLRFRRRS